MTVPATPVIMAFAVMASTVTIASANQASQVMAQESSCKGVERGSREESQHL